MITDFLKEYFLQGYATKQMSMSIVIVSIMVTAILSIYIFIVYKQVNKKSFYNKNYNVSLISIAIITSAIILTIQSNIVVSLGMVGALSIIRFRTAIKDPLDLVFMFWAISVGIICGAGFGGIALIASIVLTVIIVYISNISVTKSNLILVLNLSDLDAEDECMNLINHYSKNSKLRAKSVSKEHVNLVIEIEAEEQKQLIRELIGLEYVIDASIVENVGDVTA